jgi:hypothetical protein
MCLVCRSAKSTLRLRVRVVDYPKTLGHVTLPRTRFYVATGIELEQLVQEAKYYYSLPIRPNLSNFFLLQQGFSVSMCLEKRAIALALDVLEKERDAIKKSDAGQNWRFYVLAEAIAHFNVGDAFVFLCVTL